MLIFRRLLPPVVALSCAASCVYYAAAPDQAPADGGGLDASASSSGVGASSSGGFEIPPAFAPTFDNDAGSGVRVYSTSCPTPTDQNPVTDGTYTYFAGCMEDARFPSQFPICREGAVVKNSLAKVDGSVVVSSGGTVASRSGTLLYAVDIDLPCRQAQGSGSCNTIEAQLRVGLGTTETPALVNCYDVSEQVCNCQVEAKIDMGFGEYPVQSGAFFKDRIPFWVDQLGTLTITRNVEDYKLYPEAAGYWRLRK